MYRQSYGEMFKEENLRVGGSIHFGAAGMAQHQGMPLIMASFTFAGVYLDVGGWVTGYHEYYDYYEYDKRAISAHAGYTIPVTSYLRITPLFGYTCIDKYYESDSCEGFDFGAQVTINLGNVNIHATYTKYTWYAGVGVEI